MSAQLDTTPRLRRMNESDLDAVMAIENVIYTHPWSRGNFTDSLTAQSHGFVLEQHGVIVGYAVLMTGAGEAHLLNLSIAAAWQRRGLGRELLYRILYAARELNVQKIFLEVRVSNVAARALYAQAGFCDIGLRKGYYPAFVTEGTADGREDAIVLAYALKEAA